MFCRQCGTEIKEGAKFCINCGTPVADTGTTKGNIPNPEITPTKKKMPTVLKIVIWLVVIFCAFLLFGMIKAIMGKGTEIAEKATEQANARTEYAEQVAEAMINGEDPNAIQNPDKKSESPAAPISTPTSKEKAPADDGIIDCDIDGCHVKYLSHEIVVNMAGDTCLAVYFQFENNSNEPKSFTLTVNDKAYQDGIELSFSIFHVNDMSKDSDREIQPGVSLIVCSGFELRNEMSDIEMTVAPLFTLDNKPTDSMILSIEDL